MLNDSHIQFVTLTDDEFNKLRSYMYENFGINLTEAKRGLIQGRLQIVLMEHNLSSFGEYYKKIVNDKYGNFASELINKLSTNFTYFYRESDHFDFMNSTALPFIESVQSNNQLDLRLWCAGCASGEEAYTLAILLHEYFKTNYSKWTAGVLATDISERVLEIAKEANYSEEQLKKIPESWHKKYFIASRPNYFTVKDHVRKDVIFRRLNLMNDVFPFRQKFHLIFCRNVMIYFDQKTRHELVKRFAKNLVTGGYLFIGHAETIGRDVDCLKYIKPAVYQKVDA